MQRPESAAEALNSAAPPSTKGPSLKETLVKIVQLELENHFSSRALGKLDGLSAKR